MAQIYTLTINIEQGGTQTIEENGATGSSIAGHMWYQISDGTTNGTIGYGFAPDQLHEGQPFAQGINYINKEADHYVGDPASSLPSFTWECIQALQLAIKIPKLETKSLHRHTIS